MKRLAVAIAAMVSMAVTSAVAADLPARVYTKAPVIPPVIYDWTGFYVGGNVGYGWGRERDDGTLVGTQDVFVYRTASGPPAVPTSTAAIGPIALYGRSNMNGIIGGGQAGYNWQRGTWVLGLESDFQGSDERSNGAICTVAGCPAGSVLYNTSYRLDWFGTVRGRVGFLARPQLLLYATGGLAYGHLSASEPTVPLNWGDTRAGWTIGAGGEVAIDSHWSVKLEYLYMDLGSFGNASASTSTSVTAANVPRVGFSTLTVTNTTAAFNTRFTDNIVRVGLNYRFGGPVVAKY